MTYKQIEASRELRLWIGQVVVPAFAAGAVMLTNPEIKARVTEKFEAIKRKFKKDKEIEAD